MLPYRTDAHTIMASPVAPAAKNQDGDKCDLCPYNKGEGIFCIGHCLKELLKFRENGG